MRLILRARLTLEEDPDRVLRSRAVPKCDVEHLWYLPVVVEAEALPAGFDDERFPPNHARIVLQIALHGKRPWRAVQSPQRTPMAGWAASLNRLS